jgi:hypothetical protein
MIRKRIQVSFAHTQPATGVHQPGGGQFAGMSMIIDVDLSGASFGFRRNRRRKEDMRGNPPPHVGGYERARRRVISVRTDPHTVCIFYRHVL